MNKFVKTLLFSTALCLLIVLPAVAVGHAPALIHLAAGAMVFLTFRASLILGKRALARTDLKDPVFIPNAVYRNLSMTFLLLYVLAEWRLTPAVSGFIAVGIGFILIAGLKELHYTELLRSPAILFYYFVRLVGGSGYLWLGVAQIRRMNTGLPLYLISFGYLGGAILLVIWVKTFGEKRKKLLK